MSQSPNDLAARLAALGYPPHIAQASPEELIARWDRFVREVERGYGMTLEDYLNDLDLRAILEEAGLAGRPPVQDADARLRRLLEHTAEPLWPEAPESAFWCWGYPKNAAGDLRADLVREGWLKAF